MKQRGFTLIEILIAISIFAMIGVASTGLLTTVIDSNEMSQSRFEKLQQLQRAMLTIERDIQQAVPRQIRVNGERQEVVMQGGDLDGSDAGAIAFVRSGWHNPQLMLPRSTLQNVAYRLKDGNLERVYSTYVDNVVGYEPKSRALLGDVTDLKVEFVAGESTGLKNELTWSESYKGTVLPRAIAFEFTSKDFGTIRRVFAISGEQL